jgi:catechol 2,3-dioxygenase
MNTSSPTVIAAAAEEPLGLNHVVLQVRDLEESHHFYTEILGFRHVGTWEGPNPSGAPRMRFYSGVRNGKLRHHDFALVQATSLSREIDRDRQSLQHLAFEYSSKEAFYRQLDFVRSKGVPIKRLIERGATHSADLLDPNGYEIELVFELPREDWEDDINGAINRAVRK